MMMMSVTNFVSDPVHTLMQSIPYHVRSRFLCKVCCRMKKLETAVRIAKPRGDGPDAPERVDVGVDDAVAPAVGQAVDFVDRVADAVDHVGGAGQVAEAGPQAVAQQVLQHGRRDGDADGGAGRAKGVRGRGDDGLVFVVDGGDERDEGDGQRAAVRQAVHEQKSKRWRGVDTAAKGAQDGGGGGDGHELHEDVERQVAAGRAHQQPRTERAQGGADRLRHQTQTGAGGGGVEDGLKVNRDVVQQAVDRHGDEPIG